MVKDDLTNSANTVGIRHFKTPFKKENDCVYALANLKQAIISLSDLLENENEEIRLNILKMDAGPLLTLRIGKKSQMAFIIAPIVRDDD